MKRLLLLCASLVIAPVFGSSQWVQKVCMHDLKVMGAPTLPNASDVIEVFSLDVERDAWYSVSVTYEFRGTMITESTEVRSNSAGLTASFKVSEAKEISVAAFSIRKVR